MRPRRTKQSDINLLRMGVPKHFLKTKLNDYKDEQNLVKPYIKDYISNISTNIEDGMGLFFYGSNGVGKSMLSCIIMKEAYMNRYTCKRCTFMEYINEYTRMWGCKNEDEKSTLEENFYYYYKGVELLVIEEIGKEVDTKISVTVLEDLLRYREEHMLATIVCTNLAPKDIKEKYGASIFSLITGNFTPIKIVGNDQRKTSFNKRGELHEV